MNSDMLKAPKSSYFFVSEIRNPKEKNNTRREHSRRYRAQLPYGEPAVECERVQKKDHPHVTAGGIRVGSGHGALGHKTHLRPA